MLYARNIRNKYLLIVEIYYIYYKIGKYRIETAIEEGRKSVKSNYIEHPIGEADFPPIRRIDEGRIYGRIFTTDRDSRAKRIASKYLYTKYYTILYL